MNKDDDDLANLIKMHSPLLGVCIFPVSLSRPLFNGQQSFLRQFSNAFVKA